MEEIKKTFVLGENLFKLKDNYLCVSDEEIGENEYAYGWGQIVRWNTEDQVTITPTGYRKIIFSTDYISDSIPVLEFEGADESVLEAYNSIKTTKTDYHVEYQYIDIFEEGYKKAKETYQFTEDDIKNVVMWVKAFPNIQLDDIIASLKQPKEIQSIEVEYDEKLVITQDKPIIQHQGDKPVIVPHRVDYLPITLANGKVKCEINYKQ